MFGVAFNRDSTMLGCVSDHGTVHVFALDLAGQQADAAAAATPVAGDASPVGDAPAAESPTPAPAPALVNKTSRYVCRFVRCAVVTVCLMAVAGSGCSRRCSACWLGVVCAASTR